MNKELKKLLEDDRKCKEAIKEDLFPDSDVMYLTTSLEPVIFMEAYEWEDEEDYERSRKYRNTDSR